MRGSEDKTDLKTDFKIYIYVFILFILDIDIDLAVWILSVPEYVLDKY